MKRFWHRMSKESCIFLYSNLECTNGQDLLDRAAGQQVAQVLELGHRRRRALERLEALLQVRERLLVLLRLDELDELIAVRGVEEALLLLHRRLAAQLVDLHPVAVCANGTRAQQHGADRARRTDVAASGMGAGALAPRTDLRMRLKYERCVCFSAAPFILPKCGGGLLPPLLPLY